MRLRMCLCMSVLFVFMNLEINALSSAHMSMSSVCVQATHTHIFIYMRARMLAELFGLLLCKTPAARTERLSLPSRNPTCRARLEKTPSTTPRMLRATAAARLSNTHRDSACRTFA